MTGIKQLLLILAVVALVGCGESKEVKAAKTKAAAAEARAAEEAKAAAESNTLEAAIRRELNKPTGELTKADYEKVTRLELFYNSIADSRYKITDAVLKELVKLEKLTELMLNPTQITDAGLKESAKMEQLEKLYLPNQITDAGLKDIAKMKQLTTLTLSYNRNITDAGLKEVAKLKQLRILQMQNTKATKAGVAALQKALPDCNIISNPKK